MRFSCLGTGSAGNCTIVEEGDSAIMVDAGFKYREFMKRCALIGFNPTKLRAIFLSHDHSDHAGSAVDLATFFRIPIFATAGTFKEMNDPRLDRVEKHFLLPTVLLGIEFVRINGFQVEAFPVPHDAAQPVGFRIHSMLESLAICLDLGEITDVARTALESVSRILLDCNHDTALVARSGRPAAVRERIVSPVGHLSNLQVSDFLRGRSFNRVVLGHLSRESNDPILALSAMPVKCELSLQGIPTGWF